jgi:2-hydroxychromene-2-carboxylate isomerase
MAALIDYYFSLNSPWSYLGHARLLDIARRHGAALAMHPVNFSQVVFPATGGLPVPQRSAQRQAYRIMELKRWRDFLSLPLNLQPAHWPADERLAAGAVMVARDRGDDAASLAGAIMRAVWAEERDIADPQTLRDIAREQGVALADLLESAATREEDWLAGSRAAIARGVFGAPSYLLGEEVFWGQDRLDFLDRALAASH